MAGRPHKEGLDYFSLDVDFFENKKVRRIMRACGPGSAAVLTCLLCNIYRNKGYYILWDEDLPFDIADTVGVSEGAVTEVVNKALQVGFFSNHQYQTNKILTSEEIQSRYLSATVKRSEVAIIEKFTVFSSENGINDAGNPINGGDNEQSKVKYSKGKERKEGRANALVPRGGTHANGELKTKYDQLVQSIQGKPKQELWNELKGFIQSEKPHFIDPYVDAWNVFADTFKLARVDMITDKRKKKFSVRIQEPAFDFIEILSKIRSSPFAKGDNPSGWKVDFNFIINSEDNYVKILEGKYD